MDFGLAQQIRPGEELRLTQTGMILGSPAYMSPEQVEGDPTKVGPAADQYGLGVILYELLTGQVPFVGSLASVMGQIVSKEPTPPSRYRPGLDPRIDAVCLKMLAKNPADRFPSLSAVADELAAIVRNPAIRPASKPPARNSWKWWALGSAAAVGIARGRDHLSARRKVGARNSDQRSRRAGCPARHDRHADGTGQRRGQSRSRRKRADHHARRPQIQNRHVHAREREQGNCEGVAGGFDSRSEIGRRELVGAAPSGGVKWGQPAHGKIGRQARSRAAIRVSPDRRSPGRAARP